MLTVRAYLALAGIGVLVALALSLIAWGRERDVSAELRRDLTARTEQHAADLRTARAAGERAGTQAAQAATQCAGEGSDAFDRGVQVGMAVCAARQ